MNVEKYDIVELSIDGVKGLGLVENCGVFSNGENELHICAFKCKDGSNGSADYKLRFCPMSTGHWEYHISLGGKEVCGSFDCIENSGNNHGPVVAESEHFRYADGEKYIPVGTTCYAWLHQTEDLQQQTLATLADAPFNKIRMCVFPKSMPYNNNEPDVFPFGKKADGAWDVSRPEPAFWDKLDLRLKALMDMGIEADLILFHPYDRWGFSRLSLEDSLAYLSYCIARLSAYRNLWWSLANEYEVLSAKTKEDWDAYGELVQNTDVYNHLLSIHNMISPYPKRSWMTHCSIQAKEIDRIIAWKQEYGIPVIIDECGYEGNLPFEWGSFTGFEMVHRFWQTICRGGFCSHGETFHRDDEVLWWAKGGKLYGESASRLAFMKDILYQLPGTWHSMEMEAKDPNHEDGVMDEQARHFQKIFSEAPCIDREIFMAHGRPMALVGDHFYLEYFGRIRPSFTELRLKTDKKYRIEVIDIWEMTRHLAAECLGGCVKIGLPGKEGIAVLAQEIRDDQ